jgi:hypothetical protein
VARRPGPERPEREGLWKIWIQRPDRIRQETEGQALSETRAVVVGGRWSMWDEHNGLRTNQGEEEVRGGGIQYAA